MIERRWIAGPLCVIALAACESGGEAQALASQSHDAAASPAGVSCTVETTGTTLPDAVRETSGLARSGRDGGLFWTHNDAGNGPELFAIDAAGQLVAQVTVPGAEATDWEDIESGPCEDGTCLYIGDIGDNDGERERITIYRVPEPARGATETAPAVPLHARYPDGPRDAESLFRLPSGELFIVTKGRREPVAVYRYPLPERPGETVTLERVRELFPQAAENDDRVTAATASPDGRWVGIRSYRRLYLYPAAELVGGGAASPAEVDLEPVGHGQGEALIVTDEGEVWLSSEAENRESRPLFARMRCTLPAG